MNRHHDQNPQGVAEGLQERHQSGAARRFLLQNGDALVLEGLAELDVLRPLRVDRQRRHDHVGSVVNQLPDQTSPFLFASSCWINNARVWFIHGGACYFTTHLSYFSPGESQTVRQATAPDWTWNLSSWITAATNRCSSPCSRIFSPSLFQKQKESRFFKSWFFANRVRRCCWKVGIALRQASNRACLDRLPPLLWRTQMVFLQLSAPVNFIQYNFFAYLWSR